MSYTVKIKFNNTYSLRKARTMEELLVSEFGLFKHDYFWLLCECNREEFLSIHTLLGDYIEYERANPTRDGWDIIIKLSENRNYYNSCFNKQLEYDFFYHLLSGIVSCWNEQDSKNKSDA